MRNENKERVFRGILGKFTDLVPTICLEEGQYFLIISIVLLRSKIKSGLLNVIIDITSIYGFGPYNLLGKGVVPSCSSN